MELITFVVLLTIAIALPLYSRRKRYRLPPGPKGLPIVGNAFDVLADYEWLTYAKWSREYDSDIIYLNIAGTPIYVLNSVQATTDLLEKRSSIYSDREIMTMCHEIVGWGQNFALMPYGDSWREHRRMFHQHFHPGVVDKHHAHIEKQAKDLLRRIHANPDGLMKYLRIMAGAAILRVVYGIDVQPENDHYIGVAEAAIHSLALTGNAGSYLVDNFPILRYLPSWAPGAQFKRDGERWRAQVNQMFTEPLDLVKQRMANGEPSDCVAATLLASIDERKDKPRAELETVVKHVSGTAYVGGADTTVSSIATFVLAMLKFPQVQRIAQAELDNVIGIGRLPSISERPSLPYITAVMKESLRWNLVLPSSVPRKMTTDDEYRGYFIPAGSLIIANAWAVLHDETRYPNPDVFDPTRFLTSEGKLDKTAPDPVEACFGFGRRICPGRHFAMDTIWLNIAYILTTFNIEKPLDPSGQPVEPSGKYTSGFLSHPVPFKVNFTPRSKAAEALIREAVFYD
ncbi:cytochrome P450 [Phanerochaete sordida]|uniref:Cytochrome P450 n=1 Tax=Phanerochaete sordida TaxID=48140 RepID=A0A9P3L7M6_9APHY|nr:cytochrome P450 [Phanerochaete sordida]